MIHLRNTFVILFCVGLYSCVHKPIKEGYIRYKISYSGNIDSASIKLLPNNITLNFKNSLLRLKMSGGIGNLKPIVIADGPKGILTFQSTNEQIETKKLLKKDTSLEKTGISEVVSGYGCTLFKAANRNTNYSVWVAKDMPLTINGTSRLEGFYLANYSGIPLKIIDKEQDFTINFVSDSISIAPQSDSLFTSKPK
jgi:hypothetical protein